MGNDLDIEQGIPDYDFPLYTKVEIENRLKDFVFGEDANYEAFFERFQVPDELETNLKFKSIKIEDPIKEQIKAKKFPAIFKNHFEDDFSLTSFGFSTIIATGLYPRVFGGELTKRDMSILNTLVLFRNFFHSPYFIQKTKVYYFDGAAHAEIMLYGSMKDFVEKRRTELC